jgi:Zn-dependent peptidase ImmA (M78 family)
MRTLIDVIRSASPKRPLSYGESLSLARRQAGLIRQLLGATEPEFDTTWLIEQTVVPVRHFASYEVDPDVSGYTKAHGENGELHINKTEPIVRQRFTLLHEFKHLLDARDEDTLHAYLGGGNKTKKAGQIESICNEFAASLLMPLPILKDLWSKGTRETAQLARIFNVSGEAMNYRLIRMGFKERKPWYRRYGLADETELSLSPCAA